MWNGLYAIRVSSSPRTCTLGYTLRAIDNATLSVYKSNTYFILPSHCTATFGVTDGTIVGQPNVAYQIGHEVYDPPTTADCAPGRQCRRSDAALFSYDAGVSATFAKVAHAVTNSPTLYQQFPWSPAIPYTILGTGFNSTYSFLPLIKVGSVTGQTSVNSYTSFSPCVDIPLYDQSGNDTGITLKCQTTAAIPASDDDSGAPVVDSTGPDHPNGIIYAGGMLWGKNGAGVAAYTDTGQIVDDLNHYPHLVSINYSLRVW